MKVSFLNLLFDTEKESKKMVQVEMTNTQPPNVLKKPIGTKRIIATATTTTTSSSTPTTLVIDSKRMKYDDNKIAERVPIEEVLLRFED